MTSDTPKPIYWDSNCFLAYVNAEANRVDVLAALLASSARGDIELYASAVSQAEVAFSDSERRRRMLDPETERRIDDMLRNPRIATLVDFNDSIGRTARSMTRAAVARGWSLKPMDAIHLATARWLRGANVGVDEFHTYDDRLFRYADICGFRILEPYVERPDSL